MKKLRFRVVMNGKLPPVAVFDTFDDAMLYVSNTTGETFDSIKQNHAAGCPTCYRDTEFDIEKCE